MDKTYNLGRVVGWSNYEEFLKENPTVDPATVTRYIYETLVTYGVTRVVGLSSAGWRPSNGGKFYTQTVKVPGASWGAVPIVGLDYEYYMQVFTNPAAVGLNFEQKRAEAAEEADDVLDKTAVEEAVGNIFGVYVSDSQGRKVQSSADVHGYLTFMAYPDVLKFQDDVSGLDSAKLRLIVRGLSLEDLVVDELYFGPQGFIFAGNGLVEDCYHKTENINNLMVLASSYIELAITGNAISDGAAYKYYQNAYVQLEGVMSGYIDLDTLESEGYLMTSGEIASFLTSASKSGILVTKDAYDEITDKTAYSYMVYGKSAYEDFPGNSNPLYILCVRKTDGYTGLGVMLDYDEQADLGYDKQNPDNPPERALNMLHVSRTGSNKVVTLKDKFMPDYLGAYWTKDNGWNGNVSYVQQNGISHRSWEALKEYYGAVFHDTGRNSYITCSASSSRPSNDKIRLGDFIMLTCDSESDENAQAIRGMYVCTESSDTDPDCTTITLNRRGGYLTTVSAATKSKLSGVYYTRLPQWNYELHTSTSGEEAYLTANMQQSNRIYQNELIYVQQPGSPGVYGLDEEWQVINIATDGNADLIVRTCAAFPLGETRSDVANYTGTVVNARTNAITLSSIGDLMPDTISVQDNPYDTATSSYVVIRGTNYDNMTVGTIVSLKHSVSGVFGENKAYWYQFLGIISNKAVLASSVSQKDGTNFYTLAKMTSHLNQGFPRSKQAIPDSNGSYYYNYPKAVSKITVGQFFEDFDLDIEKYLHPDFRNTSMLKFLQNLIVYKHLGKAASATNKRQLGFKATYRFFTKSNAQKIVNTKPTEQKPVLASLLIQAETDPASFTSPGFFTARHIEPVKSGTTWIDNPTDEPFNIANPEYPIWATIAKSRNGEQTMSVSLIDDEGNRLNDSGSEGTIEADTVTPHDWLVGLALGKSIDVLKGMRVYRTTTNCNYLVTADNTRLYISKDKPDPEALDIPLGSIGIGW